MPNRRRILAAARCAAFCAALLAAPATAEPATVTATLTYRERIALPPDAQLLAEVRDGDGRLLATTRQPTAGAQVPLPVTVTAPETAEVLVLRAGLVGAGAPWVSDPVVLPRGGTDAGAILLRRVAPVGPARAWRCGDDLFWLAPAPDGARLRRGGAWVDLVPVPAASGAKAADPADPGTFAWSKGNELTLSWQGTAAGPCAPALDPLAAAFSGRGSEPDWRLDIGPGGIDFAWIDGPGLRRPLPAPEITATGQRHAAEGLVVTLDDRLARDAMTGMPYPVTVTVETAEGRFAGTGGDPADLLQGLDWRLAELGGAPVPDGVAASLRFDGRRITGSGGCNRFAGSADLTGEGLRIGPVAATMMACPGPQMATERALFSAFDAVRGFDIDAAGALVLRGDRGALARFLP